MTREYGGDVMQKYRILRGVCWGDDGWIEGVYNEGVRVNERKREDVREDGISLAYGVGSLV